jgi:hypothetical protein
MMRPVNTSSVMAGPAIPMRGAHCLSEQVARDTRGHDN